ncbi:MAG: META domain-containing protein [Rhizobiaceae bacterium]
MARIVKPAARGLHVVFDRETRMIFPNLRHLMCAAILVVLTPTTASAAELTGTSWRLVRITSASDRIDEPEDRDRYTIEFQADGSAAIGADCNRGFGSWRSEAAGQLEFGPIATTKAMCPPGSLFGTYLASLGQVSGYEIKEGHLHLATTAEGSGVELEPVSSAPLAATVLGEAVRTEDVAVVRDVVLGRLFEQFAQKNGIRAEREEIDAHLEALRKGMGENGSADEKSLTPEEAEQLGELRQQMARSIIRQWKINKALYDTYGGRIIYQQLGPEPLDAYRNFLEQRRSEGAFEIHGKAMADAFWRYFTDDSIHDFMEPGGADEARAFAVPPWQAQ